MSDNETTRVEAMNPVKLATVEDHIQADYERAAELIEVFENTPMEDEEYEEDSLLGFIRFW